MKTHYHLFILLLLFSGYFTIAQEVNVPSKYSDNLTDYKEVKIDVQELKSKVRNAQMKGTTLQNRNSDIIVELPIPSGELQQFRVVESPILSAELSASRPNIKSYIAKGLKDETATARFNITSVGFYGIIKSINGISIIEKINRLNNDDRYITYYDHDIIDPSNEFVCTTDDTEVSRSLIPTANRADSCFQIGDNLRLYELVVTCSGEFYALNGNTDTLVEDALLNRITQVNTVYETEIATTLSIVEFLLNNDPATDPYSDPTNTFTSINDTANYINANVTVSSWDIGHGFHEITCGGGCGWAGRAGLGVVCTPSKASGYTYLPNDIPTAITVLLHEFGHQFSNRHTNYGCDSNNACSRYEPGQGSTIMSTGANCDGGDFFASRTDYFSVASLQNMVDFMGSGQFVVGTNCETVTVGGWSDCATLIPTGNSIPSSNANANNINGLVIPYGTPFELSGSGSDADGLASLTYNWEQYDTDYSGSVAPDDATSNSTGPLFRSFPPSVSSTRTVPQLSSILAGNSTTGTGEVLPSGARNLTWRLTVRDNELGGGGVACDQITLSVGADGPFRISSQNSSTAWLAGGTETVTWDVANTDSAAYTCANVDILYSSDGGDTFSTTLASNIPNNGSATITAPATDTTTGRIKIVCTGGSNIFFDINDVDILVYSTCEANGGTIADNTTVNATAGDASLNLGLMSGLPINSFSGVLDANDGTTNLTAENNGTGTCISFSNSPKFETIELVSSTNSNVTFTTVPPGSGGYFNMISLYEDNFNTSNVCGNWLNSNGNHDGTQVFITDNFTESLTAGTKYVLLSSGFSNNEPDPSGNFDISFSETLYNVSALNIPGYLYTYIVVNNNSGKIIAFSDDSDFSNPLQFPDGNYTVYGLSYVAGEPTNDYVGATFSTLQTDITNTSFCGSLSSNTVSVNITGSSPVTYISNNGVWSPSSPIGVSNINDTVIIQAGDVVLSNDLFCNTFTVNPGASVTINSGATVSAASAFNLESNSTSYSSLIRNGTINGIVSYNRYTAQAFPAGSNDLISAPLSGQNFGAFSNENIDLTASGTERAFAPYNTVSGAYENYDEGVNEFTQIESGIGFRAATDTGSNLKFTGDALASDVLDVSISDASAGSAWNLIGNPYPSYLDFNAFFQLNKSQFDAGSPFQAIYGYDGDASDGWTVWNQATIDGGSIVTLIAPGQGFFVKAKSGGGSVDFTAAMRATGSIDDFIAGRQPVNNAVLSRLILTNSNNRITSTDIYFIEGTTRGLDSGYDAGSYFGSASEFSIYSNLVEENTGLDMAIQSLPYNDFDDIVVPLGINAVAGEELTIKVSDLSTISEDIFMYLEDTFANTLTLLNDANYTFTPNGNLDSTGRFYIRYSSSVLSTASSDWNDIIIYASANPKEVIIKGELNAATTASLYDIQGRLILNASLNHLSTYNTLDASALSTGIYIIKVYDSNRVKTKKLIIK